MWPRSFSIAAAGVGLSLACLPLGCSGGGGSAPPPNEPAETAGETAEDPAASEWMLPAGTDLLLAIDGREEPMGAKAQLNVLEGTPTVHLLITGADGAQDLVILDLEFDGVESSLGPHQGTVGLPDTGYTVSASLAGRPYHSQAGYIDLSLAEDGSIQGTFNADLAEDPAVAS
ncbi:MAG TPA: hypothetical protein VJU61_08340, partial [Polyangiaceae bacterium]|nr:hypothetical protein [Polyangiaceae bacterium]